MMNSCVLSNNTVSVNEVPGHLRVPAGLVNERQIEGNLSPQVHLIVRYALSERWASSFTVYISICGACAVYQTYLQILYRQRKGRLVVMYGQMCKAQLVEGSA